MNNLFDEFTDSIFSKNLRNVFKMLNDSFGGRYFEYDILVNKLDRSVQANSYYVKNYGLDSEAREPFIFVKQYFDGDYLDADTSKIELELFDIVFRSILFSKPTISDKNKNDLSYKMFRTFADFKDEILQLKNK